MTSSFQIRKIAKVTALVVGAVVLSVGYQNCSGFTTSGMELASTSSAGGGTFVDDSAAQRFAAAKTVLDQKCNSCHNGSAATSFNMSEAQFKSSGLVTAGDLSTSRLITRLQNYPVKDGTQNMPTGAAITSGEYAVLTSWVTSMAGSTAVNQFTCLANEAPQTLDARRLSKVQIFNSIRDLLTRAIGATDANSLLASAQVMSRLPNDSVAPYSSSDNNFSALHAQAMFDVADLIAKGVATTANYSRFVNTYIGYARGTCTTADPSNLSVVCRDALIRNFLLRAWGRAVQTSTDNNELAAFQTAFAAAGTSQAGVEGMVYRALLSPEFMFHLQIDVSAANGAYRLSSNMIARRLSFLFMQSIPDEGLLALASQQDLIEETAFLNALEYASERMDTTVDLFTKEWLGLNKMPAFKETTHPKFQLIATGLSTDDALRTAMADEVSELARFVTKNKRPLKELFTSDISFARNASLMRIYGQTTAAPATVTTANAVRFPAGERSGLLTRAGVLFSGGHSENPVTRGIHVRKQMFCLTVAAPPSELTNEINPPVLNATMTTRERYAVKTAPAACIGCHSQINPVGFVFSKYNSFGQVQTQEPIFDAGSPPQLARYLATDSSANLAAAIGQNVNVQDGVEFSTLVSDSPQFKKCVTQHLYTYAQGLSAMPTTTNSCAMSKMYQTIESGQGTLMDFFKSSALDSRFRYRTITK